MNNARYIRELSKRPLYRVMAWIGIVIIIGLIIATVITGILGSDYFFGFLVLTIIVPVFIYVVLWIGKVIYNSANERHIISEEKTTDDVSNE